MFEPKSEFTKLAWEVICMYVKNGNIKDIEKQEVPKSLKEKLSCFVSIHRTDSSLRGCIGTIEPRHDDLFHEIISNAVSAATRDTRFTPVTQEELHDLEISVDVLSKPEPIKDISELDPMKYGVIVSQGGFRRGVLLPNIPGIDTIEEQLSIVKKKAGIYPNDKDVSIKKFTSTRHH